VNWKLETAYDECRPDEEDLQAKEIPLRIQRYWNPTFTKGKQLLCSTAPSLTCGAGPTRQWLNKREQYCRGSSRHKRAPCMIFWQGHVRWKCELKTLDYIYMQCISFFAFFLRSHQGDDNPHLNKLPLNKFISLLTCWFTLGVVLDFLAGLVVYIRP